jgi:galactokinase
VVVLARSAAPVVAAAIRASANREALFLDTRSLEFRRVPIPASTELIVIHSGQTHHHAGSGYVERRAQAMAAAEQLGVARLRDCGLDRLPDVAALPPLLARLTGGGFGGSIVALARAGQARQLAERIAGRYAADTGSTPLVLAPTTAVR